MNIDITQATTKSMLLPCVRESDKPATDNARLPTIEKRPPLQRALSPEQRELIEIRHTAGMSQAQFAEELAIGMPRLSSYEHGRTSGIPDWVMQAARALTSHNGMAQDSARKQYDGLEMPEILAQWATTLGIPYDDNRRLAALLGTSVPTLTRWKNRLTRPSLKSLRFHWEMVEQARLKMAKQAEYIDTPAKGKKPAR